jgi:hypothetical protein
VSDLEAVLRLLGGGSAAGHAARGVVEEAVEGAADLWLRRTLRTALTAASHPTPLPSLPNPATFPAAAADLLSKRFLPPSVIDPLGFGFPSSSSSASPFFAPLPFPFASSGMSGSKVSPPSPFPSSEDVAAAFTALESTALRLAGGRPTLPPLLPPALVARLLDGGGGRDNEGLPRLGIDEEVYLEEALALFRRLVVDHLQAVRLAKGNVEGVAASAGGGGFDSSSSSSSSSSSVGREYGDEDVLVAVGHLLNDAVDPLGAAAEFPQGKGDPMRLLRRLESIARSSANRGSSNGNGNGNSNSNSNSNSAAHGAAGTANGDDPLRDLTEELFFSEAASAGAARDLTLAAGRGVVASARARLPRGTGMPFFPPFRK